MTSIHEPLFAPVAAFMREVATRITEPARVGFRDLTIENKTDGSVVTEIDRNAEQFLTENLTNLLPGSRVLGEETAGAEWRQSPLLDAGGDVWIIDPIDGTARFIRGESYGIMVALRRDHVVAAAWVYYPDTRDMLFASKRDQTLRATWQETGEAMTVPVAMPSMALPFMRLTQYDPAWPQLENSPYAELARQFAATSRCESIALDAKAMLMQGDRVICININTPWDRVPVAYLAERAGAARVCDFSGVAATDNAANYVMAPTSAERDAVLRYLRQMQPV